MTIPPDIPFIPPPPPPAGGESAAAAPEPGFTPRDGAAWLGLPWSVIEESQRIRDGGPLLAALLGARRAQGTDTAPAQVLARHGIDPADPLAAQRAWARARFDA